MKKTKRIVLLVLAVVVLLLAADAGKTVLDLKNSAATEVQEEDSTRWAELTSDPLTLEGIADGSAKYASAAVNGSLNLVFNGIWSRQTDYFTVPGGSLTITGYGTAEGTQRYKISVWQKVAGGAQYVNDSTYYFKTDGQNYRCVISGLDPAASYRLTIPAATTSTADSRWRASRHEDTDETFAHADALRLHLGHSVRGPERRLRHGGLFLPRGAELAGCPRAAPDDGHL